MATRVTKVERLEDIPVKEVIIASLLVMVIGNAIVTALVVAFEATTVVLIVACVVNVIGTMAPPCVVASFDDAYKRERGKPAPRKFMYLAYVGIFALVADVPLMYGLGLLVS